MMSLFFVISIIIVVICILNGTNKGMLRILYGLLAWLFVFWFVNNATSYVHSYLNDSTNIEMSINDRITKKLELTYEESEANEEGSGEKAIIEKLPRNLKRQVSLIIKDSTKQFIDGVAELFTQYIMDVVSAIATILLGILIVWIVGKLLLAIDVIPGIKDVNRFLGGLAGALEAVIIIWVIMVIAEMFPNSVLGSIVLPSIDGNDILTIIYQNNLIKMII